MSAESLSNFAGPTGVGALCLLAVFLFLDGRAPDLFPTVETYAKTATWGIVAAVPVLVIAYVVGLFLAAGAEMVAQHTIGPAFIDEANDLARLASVPVDNSPLI